MDIKSSVAIDPDNSFNWLNPVSIVFLSGLAIIFSLSLLLGLTSLLSGSIKGLILPFSIVFLFLGMILPGHHFGGLHAFILSVSIICFFLSSLPHKSTIVTISNFVGVVSIFLLFIFGLINTFARGLSVY